MERQTKPARRGFLMGAAAAGAAVTAVVTLPKVHGDAEVAQPETQPAPQRGGGYRVSEHVQTYYKTTRI